MSIAKKIAKSLGWKTKRARKYSEGFKAREKANLKKYKSGERKRDISHKLFIEKYPNKRFGSWAKKRKVVTKKKTCRRK